MVAHLGSTYNGLAQDSIDQVERFLLACADTPNVKNLVVDLSNTTFFGTIFIESLFRAFNRMKRKGGKFALCGLQPYPREIIEISNLHRVWQLFSSAEEAVRVLGSGPAESE